MQTELPRNGNLYIELGNSTKDVRSMATEMQKDGIGAFLLRPFLLLDDNKSKLFLVAFCGLFATFFILYFNPFNLKQIHYDAAIGRYLPIWSAGIIGALILTVTQFGLRPLFNLSNWNIGQFLLWLGIEFVCLTTGVFILFAEYDVTFFQELMPILKYTISLALLPYIIACLIIAVFKLSARLKEDDYQPSGPSNQHVFKDEQGKVVLVLSPEEILYLKSENNYTAIFYLQNDKVERKLIRSTLKKLESELRYSFLTRIHRSYMINLKRLVGVSRERGVYLVQLYRLPDLSLNVSDSYKSDFESKVDRTQQVGT